MPWEQTGYIGNRTARPKDVTHVPGCTPSITPTGAFPCTCTATITGPATATMSATTATTGLTACSYWRPPTTVMTCGNSPAITDGGVMACSVPSAARVYCNTGPTGSMASTT